MELSCSDISKNETLPKKQKTSTPKKVSYISGNKTF